MSNKVRMFIPRISDLESFDDLVEDVDDGYALKVDEYDYLSFNTLISEYTTLLNDICKTLEINKDDVMLCYYGLGTFKLYIEVEKPKKEPEVDTIRNKILSLQRKIEKLERKLK